MNANSDRYLVAMLAALLLLATSAGAWLFFANRSRDAAWVIRWVDEHRGRAIAAPGGLDVEFRANDEDLKSFCSIRHETNAVVIRLKIGGDVVSRNGALTDAGLSHLATLPSLDSLDVSFTDISDDGFQHVESITGLTTLWMHGTKISQLPLRPAALMSLREIELGDTAVTGSAIVALSKLPQLRYVHLEDTALDDRTCELLTANLRDLEELDISGTNVGNRGISPLARATSLGSLSVRRTKVGDDGTSILQTLVNLSVFDASGCRITDSGLRNIASCGGLVIVDLSNTDITGDGLTALRPLRQLETIVLDGNKITSHGLRELANLKSIKSISLDRTEVDDEGLSFAARIVTLKSLGLRGTRVTASGCAEFRRQRPDVWLVEK